MRPIVTVRDTLWHENDKGFFTIPKGEKGQMIDMRLDRIPYTPWKHYKKIIERKGDRYCVCIIRERYRLMDKMDIKVV